MKLRNLFWALTSLMLNFLVFFTIVAFVVTCTFLLFFNSVTLSEADIRAFAPAVFFNTIVLALLFAIIDFIRRKLTVDRPAKKIHDTLNRLMNGDFNARVCIRRSQSNRFGEIADSINLLAAELSSVETLRTDFIANVSHELKTPLSVMQNYSTMLSAPGLSEEKRMEYSSAISNACLRLADLITNILKLNRLENQQIYPTIKRYDLGESLSGCLLRFENVWEEKKINIETDISDGVYISGDEELLDLIFSNLFSNAFKFTPMGGTVSVSLRGDESFATVSVSDTGCGIDPAIGAHIFEKFYQGDTSHEAAGNGLGLALVKRVLDITENEISVESTPGVGSTFTVKLRRNADGNL